MTTKKNRRARGEYSEPFVAWYTIYPRHEKKQDAQDAWDQADLDNDDSTRSVLMAVTQKRNRMRAWPRTIKTTPLPATFLRGRQWEDEFDHYAKEREDGNGRPVFQSQGPVIAPPPATKLTPPTIWQAEAGCTILRWIKHAAFHAHPRRNFSEQFFKDAARVARECEAEFGPGFDEELERAGGDRDTELELRSQFARLLAARWRELPSFADDPGPPTIAQARRQGIRV